MTPHVRGILRAVTDPRTQEFVTCFSTQSGKTTIEIASVLYFVACDPRNCLVVMPREDDAKAICVDRFQPIILESPALRRLLAQGKQMNDLAIRINGVVVDFSFATSPAALAMRPAGVLVCDELDKWPLWSGREADPVALALERTATFPDRKVFFSSTPTTEYGYIWPRLEASTNERFWVPCPHCEHFQPLVFGDRERGTPGVKWPAEERDPERILADRMAWYECAGCHKSIRDAEKMGMLARGVWCPKGLRVERGEVVGAMPPLHRRGFHAWAAYSRWRSFSEIAAQFLRSLGSPRDLMNFTNSWLAEPWKERVESIDDAQILARRKPYDRGVVPSEAKLLTAGVDVQMDHFWFAIRAWGVGERSWLVREGACFSWDEVRKAVLETSYPVAGSAARLRVQRCLIDSGDETEAVYRFCRQHRPVTVPTKGAAGQQIVRPMQVSRPQRGVVLILFNTNFWKDRLARHIQTKDGEGGEWNVHREIDVVYRQHMLSESRQLVKRGARRVPVWVPIREHEPNHLWDCEVLNVIAADVEGVRYLGAQEEDATPAGADAASERAEAEAEVRKWLGDHRGWLS